MIIVIAIFVLAVVIGHEVLWAYFATNYALNGLIIFTMLSTFARLIAYNLSLWKTSHFLQNLDERAQAPDLDDEDIETFQKELETKGKLFNTSPMAETINQIKNFGGVVFTDLNARLIKSKTGFRMSGARSGIGFMAGILVMLGLLGTFLGLLKTIDAVGEAMGSISDISGPNASDNAMGDFIGSLAKPLQGMGLAFSSSLFGLSGSLLIGFMNYLSGFVHNNFIEHVSRWIDDRIPRFDINKTGAKNTKTPGSDDLKTWLMGFVYLANENNKKMRQLFISMAELIKQSTRVADRTDKIGHAYDEMAGALNTLNSTMVQMHAHNNQANQTLINTVQQTSQSLNEALQPLAQTTSVIQSDLRALNETSARMSALMNETAQNSTQVTQALQKNLQENREQVAIVANGIDQQTNALNGIAGAQGKIAEGQTAQIQALHKLAEQLSTPAIHAGHSTNTGEQQATLEEIKDLLGAMLHNQSTLIEQAKKTQTAPNVGTTQGHNAPQADISSVMMQLNSFIEEIKMQSDTGKDVFDMLNEIEQEIENSNQKHPANQKPDTE